MRRIADFLASPVDEARWEETLEYCSFGWMKRNASKSVPLGRRLLGRGAGVFINRGTNGRWTETLTPKDVAEYEARAVRELGPECARLARDRGGALAPVRGITGTHAGSFPVVVGREKTDVAADYGAV
jgi:aryl sulfotransferase